MGIKEADITDFLVKIKALIETLKEFRSISPAGRVTLKFLNESNELLKKDEIMLGIGNIEREAEVVIFSDKVNSLLDKQINFQSLWLDGSIEVAGDSELLLWFSKLLSKLERYG